MAELDCLTDRVRELFIYNPDTGIFVRRKRRKQSKYGKDYPVGFINDGGYLVITIDGRRYRAHRIAWLYMTGVWPTDQVDHRNRQKSDNRFSNLRLATAKQNQENQNLCKRNTSGHIGVVWWKRDNNWKAQIGHNGKVINLGYFDRIEDAVAARKSAEKRLFTHA
jgi:hypothetical protein